MMPIDPDQIMDAARRHGLSIEDVIELIDEVADTGGEKALDGVAARELREPDTSENERAPTAGWLERPPLVLPSAPPLPEESPRVRGLDRYEDLGRLGVGGMGDVRRVRDTLLGRTLALKMIHREVLDHPQVVARFVEEAQATAQLQHPGIVPVYDMGELPSGRLWFTMKEVSGRTLSEVISEVHRVSSHSWQVTECGWSLRRLIDAMRRVSETLAYVHTRRVIHRDLKPNNIMVGEHDEVLVLDWGLAKVLAPERGVDRSGTGPVTTTRRSAGVHLTQFGAVSGTPLYMPPEQARGDIDKIDARSDVYALGAILYEVLSGRPPYAGRTANEVLAKVLAGPPLPLVPDQEILAELAKLGVGLEGLDLKAPEMPPPLVAVCERAMAREPSERFASAREFATELTEWLDGSKQRDVALAVVERAAALSPAIKELRRQSVELRQKASSLLAEVEPWRPEEDKAGAWAMEDMALAKKREAELRMIEEEQLLHASLTHVPDLPEAHAALARRYREYHERAESERRDASRAEAFLREHVTSLPSNHPEKREHLVYLRGDGALSLDTAPTGAEVLLHRYVTRNRRLVAEFERSLGNTPLREIPLKRGSYLLILKRPGYSDVRYPVVISRNEHWTSVPPEGGDALPVVLPRLGHLGPNEIYVPGGWYWSGERSGGEGTLRERRLWVESLVVRRFSVTNREYLDFLNDLHASGRTEEALRYAPRERANTKGEAGALIFAFDGDEFSLQPDADGDMWDPEWPAMMIDAFGARAYCDWEAMRTKNAWRLPGEYEWEKAARGVDGRRFPWGEFFDPSWACTRLSHEKSILPTPVTSHPVDESPYGLRGVSGHIRTWCADRFFTNGPPLQSARVEPPEQDFDEQADLVFRGGCWSSLEMSAHIDFRERVGATFRVTDTGLRCFRSFADGER